MQRSLAERAFIGVFIPVIAAFYGVYKYPDWIFGAGVDTRVFGKNLSFWYMGLYTVLVCAIALRAVVKGQNPYSLKAVLPPGMSRYQRSKFTVIFWVQLIVFFLIPFVIAPVMRGDSVLNDSMATAAKTAHVYLYPGFVSWKMALYLFVVIPFAVYFFGKRYCSWFCSCGNLAETVGVTAWGKKWVTQGTPRGERANANHWVQMAVMLFVFGVGAVLWFDSMQVVAASSLAVALIQWQDLIVDFTFASLVGIGAYPFWGTRIWCRYGCPLAKFMELFGRFSGSRFQVVADGKCTGIGLCTKVCPMGVDVASFAHKDKQPIFGTFGLQNSVCVGCGGCVDVCPTRALAFRSIRQRALAGGEG